MADLIDILIDNLKETFKAIEKFLLLGFTASLVLVVLAITDRELVVTQKLMIADINAPAVLVAIVALGTYFASGTFAAFYFGTRRRIVKRLLEYDPKVLEALLTYPSVVARIGAPQIIALACVGGTGMIALLLFYVPTRGLEKALAAFVMIGSPYLILVGMAFLTAVQERSTRLGSK
ncbi:MAG: hypothetical protein AABN33_14990 [Acidobacteriota bacterium]